MHVETVMPVACSQPTRSRAVHEAQDRLTAGLGSIARVGEASDWTQPAWRRAKTPTLKLRERGRRVRASRRRSGDR
ncbi:MAG: hypothetical protein AAF138_05865 [Planctomycetota bacterium]